jgi:hypothetical protein
MKRFWLLVGLVAAVCAGCGSGPTALPTAFLTGGLNEAASVTAVQGYVFLGESNWELLVTAASGDTSLKFGVGAPGTALPTGAFSSSSPAMQATSTGYLIHADSAATDLSGDYWWTNFPSASGEDGGSFALTIYSTGAPTNDGASGTLWNDAHGTLTAVMVPQKTNGPTGMANVTLSVTF